MIARELHNNVALIKQANETDVERSKKENLPAPLLKDLVFDDAKINEVIAGIESLMTLPDPVGKTLLATRLDDHTFPL